MISAITSNPNFHKLVISTGNILNFDNVTPLHKSTEELVHSLKWCCDDSGKTGAGGGGGGGADTGAGAGANDNNIELNESEGQVLRATQELNQKLTENERSEISIGAKIFLNRNSSACVEEAVRTMLRILNVRYVDNVVLAYHPQEAASTATPSTPDVLAPPALHNDSKWSSRNEQYALEELKQLWASLEQFALNKQITQLGISDLDIEALTALHETARIPPTIAQISLANCCVVPPELREFCTQHDIQLLTHSDPEVLLSDEKFIIPDYTVNWTLRYQVHLRCRGVLTAKGYILGASKKP